MHDAKPPGLIFDQSTVPRVARPLSLRTGVVASIAVHVVGALTLLFAPTGWFESAAVSELSLVPPPPAVRYVHIAPLVDRTDTPRPDAPASDRDRRSRTRERAPIPDNELPLARGTTPERVEGAAGDRPVEATPPVQPPADATATPPPATEPPPDVKVSPDGLLTVPEPGLPSIREALRGLRDHFRSQHFDNQQGGGTQPGADIQFDSKGVDFGPWLRRFRAQIYRNWFVPQAAMLYKGRVVITFNVHRDGRITDVQVIQAATTDSFNTSAENALRMSSPTLALPDAYPLDKIFFTVTFHYNER